MHAHMHTCMHTHAQLLIYTNLANEYVVASLTRCNAPRTNNRVQIFITWHRVSVRQLFLALCFYTTKHRLERLSPSQVWARDIMQREHLRWRVDLIWSDLICPRKTKNRSSAYSMEMTVVHCFFSFGFLFTLLTVNSPAGRTMRGYTFNMHWGFPGPDDVMGGNKRHDGDPWFPYRTQFAKTNPHWLICQIQ